MRTRRSQSSSDPVSETPSTLDGAKHQSVLLHETIDALAILRSDIVVDATLGGAGHAREMVEKLGPGGLFIGFDLDSDAIDRAQVALKDLPPEVILFKANFRTLRSELTKSGVEKIDKILFDLGWSAYQLDAGRGFSFSSRGGSASGGQKDEDLMMTYSKDPSQLTAATIVNEWEESSIADVIYGWGEERYARRIAKRIVEQRDQKRFTTARELGEVVRDAVPAAYRRGRLHPATKTFQALRIAVNDELGALKEGLLGAREMLSSGGRIAVITFHSIEDRLVKRTFADWEREKWGIRVTKKPLTPSVEEIRSNPRARSAKLRVFERNSISYEKTVTKNKQIQTLSASG